MATEFENDDVANEHEEDMEEDDDSDDTSSSDDESKEYDPEKEAKIRELQKQISMNPYEYDSHVEVIGLLRNLGDLERLRQARETMSKVFPLTESLWLEWLQDEVKLADTTEEKDNVLSLFDRACKDYINIGVWLEYVQFSVGFMAEEGGMDKVRNAYEKALSVVGLHASKGFVIWEAYREFENAVLVALQPVPGAVVTPDQQELINIQTSRLLKIFKRQLSIPLLGMEATLEEYLSFSGEDLDDMDSSTKLSYDKAYTQLTSLLPFENKVLKSEPAPIEAYREYLAQELARGEPARIHCLFERAIQDHCLVPEFWLQYTKYLDVELCSFELSVEVHQRAVRNCPWCVDLWLSYMRAIERNGDRHKEINETFEKAITAGLTQGSDYLQLWTGYCDFLRRRIHWDEEGHDKEVSTLRAAFERAISYLNEAFPEDGDPTFTLHQYWARIEAKFCKNIDKVRDLWNAIMQGGFGNQANMWMEYFNLERSYGDRKHCRKVLQKAINSVNDWPETVCEAYLNYEREEGTLEQYDQAVVRCDAQMRRIQERRKQSEEKEAEKANQAKKQRKVKKVPEKPPVVTPKWGGLQPTQTTRPQTKSSPPKRKADDMACKTTSDGFKVPASLTSLPTSKTLPPGYKPPVDGGGVSAGKAPPPGYKPNVITADSQEPAAKKAKVAGEESGDHSTPRDPSLDSRTVFVSNLGYKVDEKQIQEAFAVIGDLCDIRIIKNFKGVSKGYGYVEFKDELAAQKALSLDRQPVEGRPMFVSECSQKKTDATSKFKFSTDMEKNKLFVKNLPFTMTKEGLENIFKEHGELKDVRLVTYKSGAPKGIAYVEYVKEGVAAQAVLKTDGLQVGEHEISVAISCPPVRKTPVNQRSTKEFTPTLGGGKKDMGTHGKAHTQITLMPRALQRRPASSTSTQPHPIQQTTNTTATDTQASSQESTDGKMSNADFRSMLLKK